MKALLAGISLLVGIALPSYAWIHPIPDYQKQFDESDLVAVVRVSSVADTGITNRLKADSRLQFREVAVEMKIITLFKGQATNSVNCRLYRFPNKKERIADLGEREAGIEYIKATPWESGLFIPKVHRDYLVYLKRSADACYQTVKGSASHTILELNAQFASDPDQAAEPDAAAKVLPAPGK